MDNGQLRKHFVLVFISVFRLKEVLIKSSAHIAQSDFEAN